MSSSRQRTAAAFGAAGAALGVAAGVIQASIGARIPDWTGAKDSPLSLGLLTILLSLIALAGAAALRGPETPSPGRRVGIALGLLLPAVLCLSTVGRLWYLPGALLATAAGYTIAAGGVRELIAVVRADWLPGLVSVLGGFELLMAVSAGPAYLVVTGVVGGLALLVAPWLAARSPAGARTPLVVGTLPFAALTWWSAATPLLAVVALAIGLPAIRSHTTQVDSARQPAARQPVIH